VKPLKEVGRGLGLFRDTPELRFLVPLNMAMALIVAMVMTNTVVLVRGLFDLGERATAIGMAVFGVGVLVGVVSMVPLLLRLKAELIMLLSAAFAAGLLLAGTQIASFEGLVVLWSLLGIGYGLAVNPPRLRSSFAVTVAPKIAASSMPRTSRSPILRCSLPIRLSVGSVQRSILRLSLRCSRPSQGLQFLLPSVLRACRNAH
jgi:hypothetical protein